MAESDIEDAIETNATGPRKVTGDSGSVEQHSIRDQIEADRHLRSKEAMRSSGLGIKILGIKPNGAV